MKLFADISWDAIYFRFLIFMIICGLVVLSGSVVFILTGIFVVLGLFRAAIKIDEFQDKFGIAVEMIDSADQAFHNGKQFKKDGRWL